MCDNGFQTPLNPLLTKQSCPVSEGRYYVESQKLKNPIILKRSTLKSKKHKNQIISTSVLLLVFFKETPKRKMFIKI